MGVANFEKLQKNQRYNLEEMHNLYCDNLEEMHCRWEFEGK